MSACWCWCHSSAARAWTHAHPNGFPGTQRDVPGATPRQARAKKGKEAWPPGALVSKIFFACGNQVNANGLTACLLLLQGCGS